ncbi:MAG: hypothetical protein AAFW64_02445 [Pseudomonadota bacterium]
MVGSSKILTVSYGTFSCTLEGFDDPFSTMRSIAEYFRDLAADDRYFGAEPPTPDAEMLHRIAEREIQRRVEARVDGDDVILRQIDSGLVEDESDLPASEAMAEMADIAVEGRNAETETRVEDVADTAPTAEDTAPVEDQAEVETLTAEDDAPGVTEADAEEPELDAGTADETGETDASPEAVAEADADEIEDPVEDTIEDKLNRIRAVVERTRSRDLGAAAYAHTLEPEDADDEADAAELAPGFAGDVDAALITQVMADAEAEAGDSAIDDPEPSEVSEEDLSDLEALDGVEAAEPEPIMEEEAPSAEAEEDAGSDEWDDDETVDEDRATEQAVTRILSEFAPEEITAQAEARAELPTEDAQDVADDVPEMVFETDEDESAPEDAEAMGPTVTADESDDQDVDDLWNRDFDAEAKDAADAVTEDSPIAAARDGRTTSKSVHLKAPDEESERLETETETAFKEGAGTRRRSAIAHLKAAVAATRADKILSRVVGRDHAGDPEEQKDYREDLSKVVKPSRPLSTPVSLPEDTAETETAEAHVEPQDEKPSPLMLVSELRVEDQASDEDMRPRRVARDGSDPSEQTIDDDDFGAFADRMGVSDLTDLMEAAAAYTAHVEGQPHFSRPQIMRRVATIDPTVEESREAGLRAFGQLLRQGRIIKLQRGQFTIAEGSRFKPEQRIAGE